MPRASRLGDSHRCSMSCHVGGTIATGLSTVLINGRPTARSNDVAECVGPTHDPILEGCETVFVGAHPIARVGDRTEGGMITGGAPTVLVGAAPSPEEVKTRIRRLRRRARHEA